MTPESTHGEENNELLIVASGKISEKPVGIKFAINPLLRWGSYISSFYLVTEKRKIQSGGKEALFTDSC